VAASSRWAKQKPWRLRAERPNKNRGGFEASGQELSSEDMVEKVEKVKKFAFW